MRRAYKSPTGLAGLFSRRQCFLLAGKVSLACVAGAVFAACAPPEDARQAVMMYDDGFSPGTLSIPTGATVVWQNEGIYPHTVTDDPSKSGNASNASLPSGVQPWDSGPIYPGNTWELTFTVPGQYIYFSSLDSSSALVGTIKVS